MAFIISMTLFLNRLAIRYHLKGIIASISFTKERFFSVRISCRLCQSGRKAFLVEGVYCQNPRVAAGEIPPIEVYQGRY